MIEQRAEFLSSAKTAIAETPPNVTKAIEDYKEAARISFELGEDDGYIAFFKGGLPACNYIFEIFLCHEQGMIQTGTCFLKYADYFEPIVENCRLNIQESEAKVFAGAEPGDSLADL